MGIALSTSARYIVKPIHERKNDLVAPFGHSILHSIAAFFSIDIMLSLLPNECHVPAALQTYVHIHE